MKKVTYKLIIVLIMILNTLTFLKAQNVSTFVPLGSTFDDGLAMDSEGNVYASRFIGSTITKINVSGITSIFASGLNTPNGTDFGNDGYLYVPNNVSAGSIVKISSSGVTEPFIPSFNYPASVLFRADGKIYICSSQQNKIFLADSTGSYTELYSGNGLNGPLGMREDENGNLLISNFTDGKIFSVSPAGVFTNIAQVPGFIGFIEYANGFIYATGFNTNKVYRITLGGQVSVLAGTGSSGQANGPAASATFSGPNGIIASPGGDSLFISDFYARSLRLITGVTTGVVNISSLNPDGYTLNQNYPNPFNPSTTIEYQIPAKGMVSVKIFDVNGRELETLVNENQFPGSYRLVFNGSNYSSGVYYYTINTNEFSETKKMLMVK